jgi:uncharacterized protein
MSKMESKLLNKLAGDFHKVIESDTLSPFAKDFILKSFKGIEGNPCDMHVHLVGKGTGGTGCEVNSSFFSMLHPMNRLKYEMYLNASGIDDRARADQEYLERLINLYHSTFKPFKIALLAMDKVYNHDGSNNESDTSFYVPNEYVMEVSGRFNGLAVPCISIHPYRNDAIQELEKWAQRGVKMVKWLPNSMGIDPSHRLCEPFYQKMKEYDMVLLCHVGKEDAVQVIKFKPFGNPLLLRKALDSGVKVIMAHCGSAGKNIDLDNENKKMIKNFKLFLRLMNEEKYHGLLYGDISAITQINRCGKPLKTLLKRVDLHPRLINGSDYPLPAMNATISLKLLKKFGYLKKIKVGTLREIYRFNPFLFDFVLKRNLTHPKNEDLKFSDSVFECDLMG